MKIYGSSINKKLDRFVGKDVWVKVYQTAVPFIHAPILYMRILSKSGDAIIANTLNTDIVEGNRHCRDLRIVYNQQVMWPQDKIKIIEPVEVITTEELEEINSSNSDVY